MAEIVVGAGENGQTVTATIGDQIRIELVENPTTGFRWQLVLVDAAILRLEFDEYHIAPGAGVGGGGRRLFRFAAMGPGHINLRFELKRAWEAQAARETFAVTVVVR